jgi:hypothetical protein
VEGRDEKGKEREGREGRSHFTLLLIMTQGKRVVRR